MRWRICAAAGVFAASLSACADTFEGLTLQPDYSARTPVQSVYDGTCLAPEPPQSALSASMGPVFLGVLDDRDTVYAQPEPPKENDFFNQGGVNVDLKFTYLTDYVFRGIDRSEVGGPEDAANLQFDGRLDFNIGKLPHPFIGLFVNVYNSDPESRFQEIRPYFGLNWTIRPFIIEVGHNTYIFPNREENNTSEGYGKVTLMDDVILKNPKPILSPYIMAAFDYDKYHGWYYEAGISHDFVVGDTGLVLTGNAAIAYSSGIELFALKPGGSDTGFQRYQIGMVAKFNVNTLLNIPKRYGEWAVVGYGYYTDNLSSHLRADTQIWGGVGLEFHY